MEKTDERTLHTEIRKAASLASENNSGFNFPIAYRIAIGDRVNIHNEELPDQTKDRHIYIWGNERPKAPSWAIGNAIYQHSRISRETFYAIIERSPQNVAINDMYELLHRARSHEFDARATKGKSILVVLDPRHTLPLLLNRFWQNIIVVCILTKPPRISAGELHKADSLIICPTIMADLKINRVPGQFYEASTLREVASHLRVIFQSYKDSEEHFFYSMNSYQYENLEGLEKNEIDAILVVSKELLNVNYSGLSNFDELILNIISSSHDLLIHSRWLYRLETFVQGEKREDILRYLMRRGGIIKIVERNDTTP